MKLQRRRFLTWSVGITCGWAIAKLVQQKGNALDSNTILAKEIPQLDPSKLSANPSPLLRFISVADTGTGAQGQYAVAAAMTNYAQNFPYEFVVMAGDNIYNNGEIEKIKAVFEDPYAPLLEQRIKFYAALGNHDIRTENGVPQTEYPLFNMGGKRYYTLRRGPVQLFALDTNHNADWSNQLSWLENELKQSQAPWKIVFGHHQIYSSAHYGLNHQLIKTLTPLFQNYGVQVYINGHEHVYERTYPINGTTYLICGAGAGVRDVGRSEWTAHSASDLSFAAYEVYDDRLVIQGIGTDNRVFDRGVIPIA